MLHWHLKLNAQNANGSTIDVLAKTSYLRQKEKASTDAGEANSEHYVCLLFFLYLILKCQ